MHSAEGVHALWEAGHLNSVFLPVPVSLVKCCPCGEQSSSRACMETLIIIVVGESESEALKL